MNDIQHTKAEMLVRTLNPGAALHATHEGGYIRFEERDGSHLLRTMLIRPSTGESITDVKNELTAICAAYGVDLWSGNTKEKTPSATDAKRKAGRHGSAALFQAAKDADWMQVVYNQGPPCFHLEDGRFCLRAERWDGHKTFGDSGPVHDFVSLENLLRSASGEHTA